MSTSRNSVKASLTPRTSKRPKRTVENNAFGAFARRILRALGRRVGLGGDVEALADLVALEEEIRSVQRAAVLRLRAEHGYSWAEIASRLGITKQAAFSRWGGDR